MEKRLRTIMLTMVAIVLLLLFAGCHDDEKDAATYAIGDTGPSGVGIVFYITDEGLHGYEVAPADQSTGAAWSNITDTAISTTGTAIGTGSANTDNIIGQSGHTASAAQICRSYRATEEGDWFLPSKDELNAIWDNLVDDGTGLGGFETTFYQSSSEISSTDAWRQRLDNGAQSNYVKYGEINVRAIRAF